MALSCGVNGGPHMTALNQIRIKSTQHGDSEESPKCFGASAVMNRNPFTLEYDSGQNEVANQLANKLSVRPSTTRARICLSRRSRVAKVEDESSDSCPLNYECNKCSQGRNPSDWVRRVRQGKCWLAEKKSQRGEERLWGIVARIEWPALC